MKNLPEAVDLTSLIASLRHHPSHAKLHGLAVASQRAQSCAADLSLAQTTMEALAQASQADAMRITPLHLTTIQHGLVANAVVLYARATSTHSDGGERGSISIASRLEPDELIDHDILVALRNRVIAHVHSEEAIDDNVWHRERMIMRESGGPWLPACATRRVQNDDATVRRLRRMIPRASELVRMTFYKRIGQLTELLNQVGVSTERLHNHPFDAVAFFGSYENAMEALMPGPGETAMGITKSAS